MRSWLRPSLRYGSVSTMPFARSARVMLFYRDHAALCQLDVYRTYVMASSNDDPFHHLSHRGYLVQGLSARQRVQCVLSHYRFEDSAFSNAYHQAVYGGGGLTLSEGQVEGWTERYHGSKTDELPVVLDLVTDVHGLGLQTAQGLILTETFYWDRTDETRAFAKRFARRATSLMVSPDDRTRVARIASGSTAKS